MLSTVLNAYLHHLIQFLHHPYRLGSIITPISSKPLLSLPFQTLLANQTNNLILKMGKELEQTFLQRRYIYTSPINTWKDIQHYQSLGKCKSKPQWDTTSHPLGWLLTNEQTNKQKLHQKMRSAGEDVEERWWECKLMQSPWKTVWRFLKK